MAKGWAGIVDPDEFSDNARTVESPSPFAVEADPDAPESPLPTDPVLAAIAELDGPAAVRKASHSRSNSLKPKLVLPQPEGAPRNESLERVTPTLMADLMAGSNPRGMESGLASSSPERAGSFSDSQLIDHIAAPPSEPLPRTHPWREYREVIVIGLLGLVAIGGAAIYQQTGRRHAEDTPKTALEHPPSPQPLAGHSSLRGDITGGPAAPTASLAAGSKPSPASGLSPEATSPHGLAVPAPDAVPAEPAPPAAPAVISMLSVVSTPPGALVEINGERLGKTPLIQPSPSNVRSLEISVRLPKFKPWKEVVTPNSAGHFSVNVRLEPSRR